MLALHLLQNCLVFINTLMIQRVLREAAWEQRLTAEDLQHVRRGGWSVREVLRHVIDSEVAYAKVIGFLRGSAANLDNASDGDVASGRSAADAHSNTMSAV